MSLPKVETSNCRTGGLNGFAATVSSVLVGNEGRVRIRITARGLQDRHIEFSPLQARQAIRSMVEALEVAEREARS